MEKLFAVIGMASNAVKDTLFKTVAREDGGSRILAFYGLKAAIIAALGVALLFAMRAGPLLHGPSLIYAVPIAALTGLTYLAALVSLVHGDASTNVPIYRLNFVLSSAFAVVFRGEALTPRKIAGSALCLLALLLFFLGSRAGAKGERRGDRRGLLASVVACFGAAGLNVMNKTALAAGASVEHLLFYRYLLIAAGCAVALALRRQRPALSGRLALTAAICAVLMLASVFFVLTALETGDLSLVVPISSSSFLFTALLSFLVLREPLSWGKVTGLAAAVAGVVVIR